MYKIYITFTPSASQTLTDTPVPSAMKYSASSVTVPVYPALKVRTRNLFQ